MTSKPDGPISTVYLLDVENQTVKAVEYSVHLYTPPATPASYKHDNKQYVFGETAFWTEKEGNDHLKHIVLEEIGKSTARTKALQELLANLDDK